MFVRMTGLPSDVNHCKAIIYNILKKGSCVNKEGGGCEVGSQYNKEVSGDRELSGNGQNNEIIVWP